MNQSSGLVIVNVEDILKTSKQLQNKMRQDIQTLTSSHAVFSEREDLPPLWDSATLDPYVKNVVADYILESSSRPQIISRPVEFDFRTDQEIPMRRREFELKESNQDTRQVNKTVEIPKLYSTQCSQTRFPIDLLIENEVNCPEPTSTDAVSKTVRKQRSGSTEYRSRSKKTQKAAGKQPQRKRELALQRFAGSSLEAIDFSREHPNIGLHSTPDQSTVFPRRFHKSSGGISNRTKLPNDESINLAAAKMREPKITPGISIPILLKMLEQNEKPIKQMKTDLQAEKKTWKEVFMNNKFGEKPKMTNTIKPITKKSPVIEELGGIDIISTPYRGLYRLEREGAQLSKQKMCRLQRLPVMYIRPECQVQRVVNISIQGDSYNDNDEKTLESAQLNVGYVECRHEDERSKENAAKSEIVHNQSLDSSLQVNSPSKVGDLVVTESGCLSTVKSSNRFIEAVESELLFRKSGKSSSSLQSDKLSVTSTVIDSLYSANGDLTSTGKSKIETAEKDIQNNTKEVSSTQQPANSVKSTVGTQFDPNDVQTGSTNTQSESSSDQWPKSSEISSLIMSLDAQSIENADTGPALSPEVEIDDRLPFSVVKTERSQTQDDETSFDDDFISKVKHRRKKKPLSRVKLLLDEESVEQSVQLSSREYECRKTKQYPTKYPQPTKQRPIVFEEKTVVEDETKKTPQNRPMEKEIKRAVKMFLNSLTSDFYSGHERTRKNIAKPINLCDRQRELKFSRLQPISRPNILNYDSSPSTGNESEEIKNKLLSMDEFTSLSILSSSNSEAESDSAGQSTISIQSEKDRSDSLSEGEVLSVGEV